MCFESSVLPENTTQYPRPGLEPVPLDPEMHESANYEGTANYDITQLTFDDLWMLNHTKRKHKR